METLAYIHYSSPVPGSTLQTFGDLLLKQKEPVAHKGSDNRFNVSTCRVICCLGTQLCLVLISRGAGMA